MTTTTHHMSLCIAGALRSFTREDWGSLFTDGAGNAVPADVARAQMQQRLDAGEALFPLGVCEGFSPQTGCPGHPVETPARPAAMTGPIIPADQWPEWADRHCWDKRGIGQFIGMQTDKFSWRKWAANSGIPMPDGHDWRVPVMRPTCKDSLPVAPAIDLEQIRVLAQGTVDTLTQNKTYPADVVMAVGHMRHLLALIDAAKAVQS